MSDMPSAGDAPAGGLQFDQAEYATPREAATCKACSRAMHDVYFEVNAQAFCPDCRERLQLALNGGSALGRFARATLFGSVAGLLGAAIYYGVQELTKINFGLISIVVGLMIGKAVKRGSNARGGWFYQGLAMFLTYSAIVLTYIPPVLEAMGNRANPDAVAGPANPALAAQPVDAAAAPGDVVVQPRPSIGQFVVALVFLTGFAYAIPVLIGFQSPMGLIIVGIGLYEAWVINKRMSLVIGGPYKIGPLDAGGAVHVQPAG